MDIFLIILLIGVLSHISYVHPHESTNYLSRETTDSMRGLFTILVIFRHYGQYIVSSRFDVWFNTYDSYISQAIVAPFLFYSGYGLAVSFQKNGFEYLKNVITWRVPRTLFRFELAIVCFLIVSATQGRFYPAGQILRALIAWDTVGNSNWYVLVIIVEYVLFVISFSFMGCGKSKWGMYLSLFSMFYLSLVFAIVLKHAGKEFYWYNTTLIFPLGVLWAYIRKKADYYLIQNDWMWLVSEIIMFISLKYSYEKRTDNLIWYSIWCTSFMIICLLITMKYKLNGIILKFCSNHVFSIYILQRIPMMVLKQWKWTVSSPYISFIIAILCTALLAVLFDSGTVWLETKIKFTRKRFSHISG